MRWFKRSDPLKWDNLSLYCQEVDEVEQEDARLRALLSKMALLQEHESIAMMRERVIRLRQAGIQHSEWYACAVEALAQVLDLPPIK